MAQNIRAVKRPYLYWKSQLEALIKEKKLLNNDLLLTDSRFEKITETIAKVDVRCAEKLRSMCKDSKISERWDVVLDFLKLNTECVRVIWDYIVTNETIKIRLEKQHDKHETNSRKHRPKTNFSAVIDEIVTTIDNVVKKKGTEKDWSETISDKLSELKFVVMSEQDSMEKNKEQWQNDIKTLERVKATASKDDQETISKLYNDTEKLSLANEELKKKNTFLQTRIKRFEDVLKEQNLKIDDLQTALDKSVSELRSAREDYERSINKLREELNEKMEEMKKQQEVSHKKMEEMKKQQDVSREMVMEEVKKQGDKSHEMIEEMKKKMMKQFESMKHSPNVSRESTPAFNYRQDGSDTPCQETGDDPPTSILVYESVERAPLSPISREENQIETQPASNVDNTIFIDNRKEQLAFTKSIRLITSFERDQLVSGNVYSAYAFHINNTIDQDIELKYLLRCHQIKVEDETEIYHSISQDKIGRNLNERIISESGNSTKQIAFEIKQQLAIKRTQKCIVCLTRHPGINKVSHKELSTIASLTEQLLIKYKSDKIHLGIEDK